MHALAQLDVVDRVGSHSSLEIEEALGAVLRRDPEDTGSALERLISWITELFGASRIAQLPEIFLRVLFAVGLGLFAYFLVRQVLIHRRRIRAGESAGGGRPRLVAERVALLRAEAVLDRERGDVRLALQKQFFALVLGLGGRGDLEFRPAWTNRELLVRGRPSAAASAVLAPLLVQLEPKEYGREPVSSADLDRLEQLCTEYFGALLPPAPGAAEGMGGAA